MDGNIRGGAPDFPPNGNLHGGAPHRQADDFGHIRGGAPHHHADVVGTIQGGAPHHHSDVVGHIVALPSLGSPIREALDQAFGDERFNYSKENSSSTCRTAVVL